MAGAEQPWMEPGGDADPASPQLPVPSSLRVVDEGNIAYWEGRCDGGSVSESEIDWMTSQRPLVLNEAQLERDYGQEEASQILEAVKDAKMPAEAAGALAWPGVGSRWRRFCAWWQHLPSEGRPGDARSTLAAFARAVGRVRTFRALALDRSGLDRIFAEDEIFPSGRLREGVDEEHLRDVIEKHGVAKVTVMRLYISNLSKIGGVDPSVSLHDDWQTTSLIASGYARSTKKVHLFELSVPAVESVGWTLLEVAQRAPQFLGDKYLDHERWFKFPSPAVPEGTWFDSTLQRTERYGLYSVPHLRNRLRRLYVFDSISELRGAVLPFVEHCCQCRANASVWSDKLWL
eukprot:TRINITY_DN114357_c0_g1_i1.p1 TRINITY_DN114357_c0_g1~~TRINITY_DN114357_c0_g1_i1.p1  ORF type:complete len:362 (-),score=32.25 TRINITY_DN114357_c0_g1_i1:104-1141(-)